MTVQHTPTDTSKKNMAFVLGSTANQAFAVGTLVLSLLHHLPGGDFDIVIINEGFSAPAWHEPQKEVGPEARRDAEILASLPRCRLLPYAPPEWLPAGALEPGRPIYYMYTFEIFRLLGEYRRLVWLDTDLIIQDDIMELAGIGPLGMALNDPSCLRDGLTFPLSRNFTASIPGYDMSGPSFNAGVVSLSDELPLAPKIYTWCWTRFLELMPVLRFADQSILNLLVLDFPGLVKTLPFEVYNCYPYNRQSGKAKIVHCAGPAKPWSNALVQVAFPEWSRHYRRWLALGGSAYTGPVKNAPMLEHSACSLLLQCLSSLNILSGK